MRFPVLLTGVLATLVAATVLTARVRDYTLSDPQLTLLTSQVLWERHSLDLGPELNRLGPSAFAKDSWKYAIGEGGRVLYAYPLGTSLLAVPVVAVGRTFGSDLSNWETDRRYQIAIAAACCAAVFALLANIGWILTGGRIAIVVAFVITLGSSLVSTLGSALWSFDVELVFALLAVREVARTETRETPRAFLVGLLIAASWICRPCAVTLAIPHGIVMLAAGGRPLLRFLAGASCVLLPFLVFCKWATGSFVARYYAVGQWARVSSLAAWPINLHSILLSPARGLFAFTPVLLFGILAIALPAVRRRLTARLLAAWVALTIGVVATQTNWWGGWGFGPRLLTEAVPGLALLGLMGWQAAATRARWRLGWVVALALAWGVAIHIGQGLYFRAAYDWNDRPNIDEAPEYYRNNWRFPQFLATSARNDAKARVAPKGRDDRGTPRDATAGLH
ncbi:MAG: hypothetical protein AB7J63_01700 [Vicinamibacterales bacterium]